MNVSALETEAEVYKVWSTRYQVDNVATALRNLLYSSPVMPAVPEVPTFESYADMTVEHVTARVAVIAAIGHDDEDMHGKEDALHVDVLTAIADGADNAPELAREALKTTALRFNRWCS